MGECNVVEDFCLVFLSCQMVCLISGFDVGALGVRKSNCSHCGFRLVTPPSMRPSPANRGACEGLTWVQIWLATTWIDRRAVTSLRARWPIGLCGA